MKKSQLSRIKLWALGCFMLLTSCSSANVSGEWDCPRQKGVGCITIEQADSIALQKLTDRNYASEVKAGTPGAVVTKGQLYEIWFAPYIDPQGHIHDASIIKYECVS